MPRRNPTLSILALSLACLAGPVWSIPASAVEPKVVVTDTISGVEGVPLYISAVGSVVDPGRKLEWKPDIDSPELAGLVKLNTDDLPSAIAAWFAPTIKPADKIKAAPERFSVYRVRVVAKGVPDNQPNGAKELDADASWVTIKIVAKDAVNPTPAPPNTPPNDGTNPVPKPTPLPAPASASQAAGRSYGAEQLATCADTWLESATMLAAGTSRDEINSTFGDRWLARRKPKFAPTAASFAKIAPDGVEPTGATRDALAQAWRDFAVGLREANK